MCLNKMIIFQNLNIIFYVMTWMFITVSMCVLLDEFEIQQYLK